MKTLIESIIGKKGSYHFQSLMEGDIVEIDAHGNAYKYPENNYKYIVITDQDLLHKLLHPANFQDYDMSKGCIIQGRKYTVDFYSLADYDEDMAAKNAYYDIIRVCRGNIKVTEKNVGVLYEKEKLNELVGKYKLIWEK